MRKLFSLTAVAIVCSALSLTTVGAAPFQDDATEAAIPSEALAQNVGADSVAAEDTGPALEALELTQAAESPQASETSPDNPPIQVAELGPTERAITPSPGAVLLETGQFGYLERRPAARPYDWIDPQFLDERQRATVQRWERSPYMLVWTYDIHPNASNNWAGWGPPPPGWTTRPATGELPVDGLPWPPPGIAPTS